MSRLSQAQAAISLLVWPLAMARAVGRQNRQGASGLASGAGLSHYAAWPAVMPVTSNSRRSGGWRLLGDHPARRTDRVAVCAPASPGSVGWRMAGCDERKGLLP
jgi:hypothetical protein